jgi:hypothetical protein
VGRHHIIRRGGLRLWAAKTKANNRQTLLLNTCQFCPGL